MIHEDQVNPAIEKIVNTLSTRNESVAHMVRKQEEAFRSDNQESGFLNEKQRAARSKGEPFKEDIDHARNQAYSLISVGIGIRLKGAYALYKAGNELECVRCILLALCSLCHILGWKKAEAYLNEQNTVLYDIHKKELKED